MEPQIPMNSTTVDLTELSKMSLEESLSPSTYSGGRDTGRVHHWLSSFRRK